MRDVNEVTREIVDAAVSIHRRVGPGLLESVYEALLSREVEQRGFTVRRQLAVPLEVDGLRFDEAFRIDLLVDERVVVELKSIERLSLIHTKGLSRNNSSNSAHSPGQNRVIPFAVELIAPDTQFLHLLVRDPDAAGIRVRVQRTLHA